MFLGDKNRIKKGKNITKHQKKKRITKQKKEKKNNKKTNKTVSLVQLKKEQAFKAKAEASATIDILTIFALIPCQEILIS